MLALKINVKIKDETFLLSMYDGLFCFVTMYEYFSFLSYYRNVFPKSFSHTLVFSRQEGFLLARSHFGEVQQKCDRKITFYLWKKIKYVFLRFNYKSARPKCSYVTKIAIIYFSTVLFF